MQFNNTHCTPLKGHEEDLSNMLRAANIFHKQCGLDSTPMRDNIVNMYLTETNHDARSSLSLLDHVTLFIKKTGNNPSYEQHKAGIEYVTTYKKLLAQQGMDAVVDRFVHDAGTGDQCSLEAKVDCIKRRFPSINREAIQYQLQENYDNDAGRTSDFFETVPSIIDDLAEEFPGESRNDIMETLMGLQYSKIAAKHELEGKQLEGTCNVCCKKGFMKTSCVQCTGQVCRNCRKRWVETEIDRFRRQLAYWQAGQEEPEYFLPHPRPTFPRCPTCGSQLYASRHIYLDLNEVWSRMVRDFGYQP